MPDRAEVSSEHSDIIQTEGVNSKGFGTIPKLVMQDRRLSAPAKAIYAYFCSYAGAGQTAFPGRDRILQDLGLSKDTYYKHFNQIRDCGYIKAEQVHRDGRLSHNVYTLMTEILCPKIQDTEIQDTVFSDTNKSNKLENKQSFNNNSPSSLSETAGRDIKGKIETYTALIRENIEYDRFDMSVLELTILNEIVSVIADVLVSDSSHVRVEREDKPRELVRSVFMKLEHCHIGLVIEQYLKLDTPVIKKRQYLTTMLYNSYYEYGAHCANES